MYRLQWSWDLKMSLLERCPHFRGCYVQASMELGPEDVSLLEICNCTCIHVSPFFVCHIQVQG